MTIALGVGVGAAIAALLAADGGAGRDAGAAQDLGACDLATGHKDGRVDMPAIEAALARGCGIDAIRVRHQGALLKWSLSNGERALTRWLLAHGASATARDPVDGSTALHILADDDSADAVPLLDVFLRRGSDIDAATKQ